MPRQCPGAVILNENLGVLRQPQNNIRAFGTGIVDRDGSLVAVDRLEIGRLIAVFTLGVLEPGWTDLPYVVTNDPALDLDDVSAEVSESLGRERSRDHSGQDRKSTRLNSSH